MTTTEPRPAQRLAPLRHAPQRHAPLRSAPQRNVFPLMALMLTVPLYGALWTLATLAIGGMS